MLSYEIPSKYVGNGVAEILARSEHYLQLGDLSNAVLEIEALPKNTVHPAR